MVFALFDALSEKERNEWISPLLKHWEFAVCE
jgi:hypothetical protein